MDTPKAPATVKSPAAVGAPTVAPFGTQPFSVTHGEESRVIHAANKREALRRFDDDDKRVEAALVKGDEKIPGMLPVSGATSPPKRRYKVTWGDQWVREVTAVHTDDAWSQAVGGKTDSMEWRNPNLYERIIEDLGPADDSAESASAAETEVDGEQQSEVADDNADEAKDKITRMRSVEKLHAIAANDTRVSVRTAAEDRIKEIEGDE